MAANINLHYKIAIPQEMSNFVKTFGIFSWLEIGGLYAPLYKDIQETVHFRYTELVVKRGFIAFGDGKKWDIVLRDGTWMQPDRVFFFSSQTICEKFDGHTEAIIVNNETGKTTYPNLGEKGNGYTFARGQDGFLVFANDTQHFHLFNPLISKIVFSWSYLYYELWEITNTQLLFYNKGTTAIERYDHSGNFISKE